jgi:hypothetical protein
VLETFPRGWHAAFGASTEVPASVRAADMCPCTPSKRAALAPRANYMPESGEACAGAIRDGSRHAKDTWATTSDVNAGYLLVWNHGRASSNAMLNGMVRPGLRFDRARAGD